MAHPKYAWRRFLATFLGALAIALIACAGLIVWADPWRNLPFHWADDRPLMDVNQRYLYPSVARDPAFDSAVFGTSTIRLLDPQHLDRTLDGRFAQLAMNDSSAWEQMQLADVFLRERRRSDEPVRWFILGVDDVWCDTEPGIERERRPFPPWKYDDDPWNDLKYLFNAKTLEVAARQVSYRMGWGQEPRYRRDGWANFLPPEEEYDLDQARRNIHGGAEPRPVEPADPPVEVSRADRRDWTYPTHALFDDLLADLPDETRLVLAFVPYHVHRQPQPGSEAEAVVQECKRRLVAKARERSNALAIDFMRPSPITTRDQNYWDSLHYGVGTAKRIVERIGEAARGADPMPDAEILLDALDDRPETPSPATARR